MKHKNFPLFLNIEGKKVLVIGAGKVATRRVKTLLSFDFEIKVIAHKASEELEKLANNNEIFLEKRDFLEADLNEIFMILLCTDNVKVNGKIAEISKKKGIFTSVCNDKNQCDFYFPAVCVSDDLIVGMVGDGSDHKKVSSGIKKVRNLLEEG